MLLAGEWCLCDDGATRPILRGELLGADSSWFGTPFLIDTGADRTVLSADVLEALGLEYSEAPQQLGGVGGSSATVAVQSVIHLPKEDGGHAVFRGWFAAFVDPAALDMSVLGRDILGHFAVIVDRPGNVVCLVGQNHWYAITQR